MMRSPFRLAFAFLLLALSLGAAAQSFPDFDQLEGKLGIRPDQKRQYDAAVGATKRALLSAALAAMQMKQDVSRELDKKDPDYYMLAQRQFALVEQQKPLFEESGREWDRVFRQLDDRQLRIAKGWIRENLGPYLP
ncbi:MAG TPA: hypothetical protein VGI57_12120 [Usitatibacter sp.]|jgi:hypothetical protein